MSNDISRTFMVTVAVVLSVTMINPTPTAFARPPQPVDVAQARTFIYQIQGKTHVSPLKDKRLSEVRGIVTGVRRTSFYMQDPDPDDDLATSDGIFVNVGSTPGVKAGDLVKVSAVVRETRPSLDGDEHLSQTTLEEPTITILASNQSLPTPVLLGKNGRAIPNRIIKDGFIGDMDTATELEPNTDGIDFFEALEGMMVQINNPRIVAPTDDEREMVAVADNGEDATDLSPRGALIVKQDDYNPERIVLNDFVISTAMPQANVGDRITGAVTGVIAYDNAMFKMVVLSPFKLITGDIVRESVEPARVDQLSIATLNCENLDANDDKAKFDALANVIVKNLQSPDLITLEEIQDNSGSENDGTTSASETMQRFITAIKGAGGPTYDYAQISPEDNNDGGQLGGNIRIVFLYREDRGLTFVLRGRATARTKVTVSNDNGVPVLSHSPGRVDPTNSVFSNSRKPLVGEFEFKGRKLFVIANHLLAKIGDQPLFGRFQPAKFDSEPKRIRQTQVVRGFIDQILAIDPNAHIITLGDLNDNAFSQALSILKGTNPATAMFNALERLPETERYTYLFQGNAQMLDHILVSASLNKLAVTADIVHVNAEFADQTSDHDPALVRISWSQPTSFKLLLPLILLNN
jgi:hypothetical protein